MNSRHLALEFRVPAPYIPVSSGPSSLDIGDAGWSSPVARQAHNLKVVGSNPTPATKTNTPPSSAGFCFRGDDLNPRRDP